MTAKAPQVSGVQHSAIYTGQVRHRRFVDGAHAFTYPVAMLYVDLDEWHNLFDQVPCWSSRRWAPGWLREDDYLPDALGRTLRERVHHTLLRAHARIPAGPIRLLTQPRHFGFAMNPISCFYCYAADGKTLEYLIAEVTNTPWRERIAYVLPCQPDMRQQHVQFAKQMHVSPFHPLAMHYDVRFNSAGEKLYLHLQNLAGTQIAGDATLTLRRQACNRTTLLQMLWRYPLMTVQTAVGIYWQALRLSLAGARFHPHPRRAAALNSHTNREIQR